MWLACFDTGSGSNVNVVDDNSCYMQGKRNCNSPSGNF